MDAMEEVSEGETVSLSPLVFPSIALVALRADTECSRCIAVAGLPGAPPRLIASAPPEARRPNDGIAGFAEPGGRSGLFAAAADTPGPRPCGGGGGGAADRVPPSDEVPVVVTLHRVIAPAVARAWLPPS